MGSSRPYNKTRVHSQFLWKYPLVISKACHVMSIDNMLTGLSAGLQFAWVAISDLRKQTRVL